MKNVTFNILLLLLFATSSAKGVAQIYSTGTIICDANLTVKLDITATDVTITMKGLSNRWFAIGFGGSGTAGTGMNSEDVVYTTGGSIVDGVLSGFGSPSADAVQSWTESSNTVVSGVRTIVASRDLNTGESADYIFSHSTTPINLIWAYGSSTVLNSHGGSGSRGATSSAFVLGIKDYTLNDKFAIYPNPSNGVFDIKSEGFNISSISVVDAQGKIVKTIKPNTLNFNTKLNLSNLSSGIYTLLITSPQGKGQKKILINS